MPPIITLAMAGTTQIAYPTVVKTTGKVAAPIDVWYMLMAPHDDPGGLYLASAPALAGPWTVKAGGPVLPTPAPNRHLSSPFVVWNDAAQRFYVYAHLLPADPVINQETYLWTTTDFVTFTWENGGAPVIENSATQADADSLSCSYFRCTWDGARWIGAYQGQIDGPGGSHICEATSPDGLVWTKTNQAGRNMAWVDDPGETTYDPLPIILDGRLVMLYASRMDTTRTLNCYRVRRLDGRYGRRHLLPMQAGAAGQWDSAKAIVGDFAVESSTAWAFYIGNDQTDVTITAGDEIGAASSPLARAFTFGADVGKA